MQLSLSNLIFHQLDQIISQSLENRIRKSRSVSKMSNLGKPISEERSIILTNSNRWRHHEEKPFHMSLNVILLLSTFRLF